MWVTGFCLQEGDGFKGFGCCVAYCVALVTRAEGLGAVAVVLVAEVLVYVVFGDLLVVEEFEGFEERRFEGGVLG